mmetsp:Transcript_28706/g.85780  ORF Transcript_28706/g.85780 Transcript_28706/m.85780 type:complete len:233 (+) Transcript_28706:237-935(+)
MVLVQVPAGASPGQTIQFANEGQNMTTTIPAGLEEGDTFEVAVASAMPAVTATAVPPPTVATHAPPYISPAVLEAGAIGRPRLTEDEYLVVNLRYSVQCFALLDIFLTLLNLFSYGTIGWYVLLGLLLVLGPLSGYYGSFNLNPHYVAVYVAFAFLAIVWEAITLTWAINYCIRRGWTGYRFFYVILEIAVLLVRIMIAQIVLKFYQVLSKVGPARAKECVERAERAVLVYY